MDHSVSCAQGQWCGLQWEVAMWATLLKGIIWPRSYGYTTPVNHRGAFKDPFHRRLLGGKARDEWISALLWVGGLDRRHSVCVRVCVLLCGCSCVCMHLPPSQKDKGLKPDDGTVLSSATHAAFQHCHINGLFFPQSGDAVRQSLPHCMCFEFPSVENCSLVSSAMITHTFQTHCNCLV